MGGGINKVSFMFQSKLLAALASFEFEILAGNSIFFYFFYFFFNYRINVVGVASRVVKIVIRSTTHAWHALPATLPIAITTDAIKFRPNI